MAKNPHPDSVHRNKDADLVLGDNHYGYWYTTGTRDVRAGLIIEHQTPKGKFCCGSVMFEVPHLDLYSCAKFDVILMDPLTLSPDIGCSCGDHGRILGGKWHKC